MADNRAYLVIDCMGNRAYGPTVHAQDAADAAARRNRNEEDGGWPYRVIEDPTRIVNLTPHAVTVIAHGREVGTWPSEGEARVSTTSQEVGYAGMIPLVTVEYGPITGLPDPADGTYLIVSSITADAARASGRPVTDLVTPYDLVRDEQGRPIGCRALARVAS